MTFITLPVGSLIRFNSNALSEHNRNPLAIGYNRIEKAQRMSNGYMRKFFIADKKTISVSWNMIPSYSNYTVDGGWGALDLKLFYESASEAFPVTITRSTQTGSTTESMSMVFTSFSCELVRRNVYSDITYKNANITAVTNNSTSITYTGANNFVTGEAVSVSGFETELYNVSNAAVTSANSTSFTVAKTGSLATITEASSDGTKFTYYATNTFSAGDVVSVSGFNTATITGASTAGGKITYNAAAHGFKVNDVVNITGISNDGYNFSKAVITNITTNSFSVAGTEVGAATFTGAQASLVYNKTNVYILSATDYYFTIADTSSQATVILESVATATLYAESTQFNVTGFVPTANTNIKYTAANHDLQVGDTVSITGVRSTAAITNAEKLAGDNVIPHLATITAVQLTSNIATVSFSDSTFSTYAWNVGDSITISNCSNSVFNGTHTVTAVPTNFSVSFAKTNTNIAFDDAATGDAANNTWSSGMIKYTSSNAFAKNDIISITGITPSDYNNASARIAYATPTYFLVPGSITTKYRKPGSASTIFNLSNVVISAVTKDTFTVPFSSAAGAAVTGLTGTMVSKQVNYTASLYAKTVATPQEFWTVSLSLEEV
jgi:hypothetical protein